MDEGRTERTLEKIKEPSIARGAEHILGRSPDWTKHHLIGLIVWFIDGVCMYNQIKFWFDFMLLWVKPKEFSIFSKYKITDKKQNKKNTN